MVVRVLVLDGLWVGELVGLAVAVDDAVLVALGVADGVEDGLAVWVLLPTGLPPLPCMPIALTIAPLSTLHLILQISHPFHPFGILLICFWDIQWH